MESLNLLALGGAYQVKTLAEYLNEARAERDAVDIAPDLPMLPGVTA